MRNNDQWFNPGDKVMRVNEAVILGLPYNRLPTHPATDYGKVLCVDRCFPEHSGNAVLFIGLKGKVFYARCFRKVEEVQLCVRAAEKMKTREAQEVKA